MVDASKPAGIEHKSKKFFNDIEAKLKEDASLVTKVKSIVGFTIGLPNNQTLSYVIDMKNAPGSIKLNDGSNQSNLYALIKTKNFKCLFFKGVKPECTISISDDDLFNISEGKLNMMAVSLKFQTVLLIIDDLFEI